MLLGKCTIIWININTSESLGERDGAVIRKSETFFNTLDNIGPIPADPGFLDLVSENVINQDVKISNYC